MLLRITIQHRRNGQSMPSFLLFQSFRMLLLFREVYQGERSQVTSSQCLYLISKRGAFLYPRHFFYKRPIRSRIKLQPQHPKVLQISVAFQSFSENPDSKHAFRDAKKILSNWFNQGIEFPNPNFSPLFSHSLSPFSKLKPPKENLTGTRGGFRTYNTTKPKIVSCGV